MSERTRWIAVAVTAVLIALIASCTTVYVAHPREWNCGATGQECDR